VTGTRHRAAAAAEGGDRLETLLVDEQLSAELDDVVAEEGGVVEPEVLSRLERQVLGGDIR
jgi:hypothetical protein